MKVISRGIGLAMGALALCFAGAAGAQENLDQGKTPAQLFASDCAICHKSPQGLAKAGGILGLESFLREHYTASRESAAAIAKYLQSAGNGPAAPVKRAAKKGGKGDEKGKPGENKAGEKKPEAGKSGETLPGDNKPPAEVKDSKEPKASESKPTESKPAESKPAESKPAETKPSEGKPADSPKSD